MPTSHPALRPFAPAERQYSGTLLRAHSGTQLLLAGHSGKGERRETHSDPHPPTPHPQKDASQPRVVRYTKHCPVKGLPQTPTEQQSPRIAPALGSQDSTFPEEGDKQIWINPTLPLRDVGQAAAGSARSECGTSAVLSRGQERGGGGERRVRARP